ncbi:hemolysin XhlA family protein [Peptoclostridium litorale]|nr:hemolysin XhlA family protein [Peptoclostridium litorale]
MENGVCMEKHKRVDEKLETHDKRLNNHSNRIDKLEQNNAEMKEKLSGLIDKLGALNTTLKWFIGLMVGSFVSFFFYAVQNNIFR